MVSQQKVQKGPTLVGTHRWGNGVATGSAPVLKTFSGTTRTGNLVKGVNVKR